MISKERVFSKFIKETPNITAEYSRSIMADNMAANIFGVNRGKSGNDKRRWVDSGKNRVLLIIAKTKTTVVTIIKSTAVMNWERMSLFLESKVILVAYLEDKFM